MIFKRFCLIGLICILPFRSEVYATDPMIDSLLNEVHQQVGITPLPRCDDATFLRRLSLDLIGRVPSVTELKAFLDDPDRIGAIDQYLARNEHSQFWSQLWTTMLVGRSPRRGVEREVLRQWLASSLADQVPLNQVAFDLIAAQGVTSLNGPANFVLASRDDPVMRLSRTFLSVQLDCAQCHDHPHDRWTNSDYNGMKRFFEPLVFREVAGGVLIEDRGINEPAEKPVFLTGRRPYTAAWRRELAWMVVRSKPFSRAMVNRTWYWLMGRGLVNPVDGWSRENPGKVPDLLEALATDLRDNDYPLRVLIRKICSSQAYQRQSVAGGEVVGKKLEAFFAARTIRQQLPEQWLTSVAQVLDRPLPSQAQVAEQAVRLMGRTQASQTDNDPYDWSATTQSLINQLAGEVPPPLRGLRQIYLATLARGPTDEEIAMAKSHSSQEILFSLVHCNEFVAND